MNPPIISIITVVYNNVSLIEKTLKSVIEQTYNRIEYIVIDGKSTDGTFEIISQYHDKITKLVSEKDKGIYDAMNKALGYATGDYVLFMNSGDTFRSNETLSKIFNNLKSLPDVIYGEAMFINDTGNDIGIRSKVTTRQLPLQLKASDYLFGMPVCHQAFFAKRSLAPQYDLKYRISADIDWCIKILKSSKNVLNTETVICNYLVGGASRSNDKLTWKERFNILKEHFGITRTFATHVVIGIRYVAYKLLGKSNY